MKINWSLSQVIIAQTVLVAALATLVVARSAHARTTLPHNCINLPSGAENQSYCMDQQTKTCAPRSGSYCSVNCVTGECVECHWYGVPCP